jgi:hypothetical protein
MKYVCLGYIEEKYFGALSQKEHRRPCINPSISAV